MSRLAAWSDQSCVCVCIYRIKVHFVSGLRFYYMSRLAAWSDQSCVCIYIQDKSAFCYRTEGSIT